MMTATEATTPAHANRAIVRKTRIGKADGPARVLTLHHDGRAFVLTFCQNAFDETIMRHADARAIRTFVEACAADDVIGPDAYTVLVTFDADRAIRA